MLMHNQLCHNVSKFLVDWFMIKSVTLKYFIYYQEMLYEFVSKFVSKFVGEFVSDCLG